MPAKLFELGMLLAAIQTAASTYAAATKPVATTTSTGTVPLITAPKATTDIAGALTTILPTAPPATTGSSPLPSECQSDLLGPAFFYVPPLDDGLASALRSFGWALTSQACAAAGITLPTATSTGTYSIGETLPCPSPEPSLWCAFPSVAPSSVLANYTSFGLYASSRLYEGLSPMVSYATRCPDVWYEAKTMYPEGGQNLHDLAIFAECFSESKVVATNTASGTALTSARTATGSAETGSPTTSAIHSPNGASGRKNGTKMWPAVVVGLGLGLAAFLL